MRVRLRLHTTFLCCSYLLVFGAWGCTRDLPRAPEGTLVVSQEQTASWIRNFNPLTTATVARWPTLAGIYEPLFVFNSVKSEQIPWLALDHEWANDKLSLLMNIRPGVHWSDGRPLTAHDVAFTFQLLREHAALDRHNVWSFLADARTLSEHRIEFIFQRVFIPGFGEIAAQIIVPEHVWSKVDDPVTFANEIPVATGPFTEIREFRNQMYEIGRNPNYWQEGRPRFEALRFPAYPANDRANLALVFDEVDWAGNFIPAVERVYRARDPEHHKYWFPLTDGTVFLYANTTKVPFDDVRVRKALSMAIDRELLVDVAVYRYSRPADATGLSDAYTSWHNPELAAFGDWVDFDLERANALLDDAGHLRGPDGTRRMPNRSPLEYRILTVSGWSDWVRACQVIARGLAELGIDASVGTLDFPAWFQKVQEGDFDLSLGWSYEGPTPYIFYRSLMSSATVEPIGENASANWHRFAHPDADKAILAFELEANLEKQHALCDTLQEVFVREVPAIPLYPNPSWAEYNTRRFTGFPSVERPYADPSPNKFRRGEVLLVLTTLESR